jgi:hypothetical protein
MKQFVVKYRKLWFSLFFLMICLHLIACSTAWTSEASSIISLLVPAIEAALGILAAAGVGLSPNVLTQIQSWATQAQTALAEVKTLITQYNTAEASAQPGILSKIQTLLNTIASNLTAILPTLHVSDPATDAKVQLVIQAIAGEISALIALLPAVQGAVTSSEELKALIEKSGYKHPKEFRKDFNEKAGAFGKQYEI